MVLFGLNEFDATVGTEVIKMHRGCVFMILGTLSAWFGRKEGRVDGLMEGRREERKGKGRKEIKERKSVLTKSTTAILEDL
jgi:hypothetical protein